MKRIGLYGGSFDPVHDAHLALARCALDHLALDEVRWIPAGHPWQKQRALAPVADRRAMLELALDGQARFVLDAIELDRSGPSYTLDTVRALQRAAPAPAEWFLLIGQDQYAKLHTWLGWRELLARVVLAVAGREGEPPAAPPELAAWPHRMQALPLPAMAVSATSIRERIARGEPIDDLVPAQVASYIETHALYRARS